MVLESYNHSDDRAAEFTVCIVLEYGTISDVGVFVVGSPIHFKDTVFEHVA